MPKSNSIWDAYQAATGKSGIKRSAKFFTEVEDKSEEDRKKKAKEEALKRLRTSY